jgi:AcrR family transcriptional regulator
MSEKPDTKSKILDAAEKLFGMNGFEATSLRDITAEAQVNLAAVNYHFQSKDSLIDAVLARRIEPVNRRRFEMLDAAGPNPTLEQILEAFMVPVLDQDLSIVVPLLGRMMSDPTQFVERVFKKYFGPVSQRIREEIHKLLPDLPRSELYWRTHFLGGMMAHIMSWSQVLPELTEGLCDISDRQAVVDRVVAFAAAGFRVAAPEPATLERKG